MFKATPIETEKLLISSSHIVHPTGHSATKTRASRSCVAQEVKAQASIHLRTSSPEAQPAQPQNDIILDLLPTLVALQ